LHVDTEDWPSSKLSVTRYSYSRSTKCGYSNSHNYLEPLWCDRYPEVLVLYLERPEHNVA
jgi:hypothetical protein